MNANKVAVVMSTYNGEKYLREQIDSILAQRNIDVILFIRDDGSRDSTAAIITEYAEAHSNIIFWNKDNIKNLGIRDSFLTLLRQVYVAEVDISYFAFADQDDVWKPDKLAAAVHLMYEQNPDEEKPALYYSNKTLVDAALQFISEERIRYYGDFYELLTGFKAFGCTMVMNRPLVQLTMSEMPAQESLFHDVWVYKVAKICGASVIFDEKSYILYRRHGDNFGGEKGTKELLISPSAILKLFSKSKHTIQKEVDEIVRKYDAYVLPENREYIEWVLHYNRSFSAWYHLALSPLAKKRGIALYCLLLARLVLRRL